MTNPTEGGHRRIDADGIHDIVTGSEAAAFYRQETQLWVVQVNAETTLSDVLQHLKALGFRQDQDFSVWGLTVYIDAEDMTS